MKYTQCPLAHNQFRRFKQLLENAPNGYIPTGEAMLEELLRIYRCNAITPETKEQMRPPMADKACHTDSDIEAYIAYSDVSESLSNNPTLPSTPIHEQQIENPIPKKKIIDLQIQTDLYYSTPTIPPSNCASPHPPTPPPTHSSARSLTRPHNLRSTPYETATAAADIFRNSSHHATLRLSHLLDKVNAPLVTSNLSMSSHLVTATINAVSSSLAFAQRNTHMVQDSIYADPYYVNDPVSSIELVGESDTTS